MNSRKYFSNASSLSLVLLIVLCGFLCGCCQDHLHSEPSYPSEVKTGWQEKEPGQKGLQVRGVFVLKKGEASNNGEIQVKVTDIIANDPCDAQGINSLPKAVIQLTRVSDRKILCSGAYTEKAYGILAGDCGNETAALGISGYRIHAISLNHGWVYFELHG